jgi:hypothetical protein
MGGKNESIWGKKMGPKNGAKKWGQKWGQKMGPKMGPKNGAKIKGSIPCVPFFLLRGRSPRIFARK